MMQGLSPPVPAPKADVTIVVATGISTTGEGVGAGVIAATVGVSVGISVGVSVGAATLKSSAGLGVVLVGQHNISYTLLSAHV
jgi:hypothetical protein